MHSFILDQFGYAKDNIITFLTLFITEVCVSVFVSGLCLRSLTNLTVLLVDTVILIFSAGFAYGRTKNMPSVRFVGFRFPRINAITFAYGLFLAICFIFALYVGHLLPPYAYDELSYHLVSVAAWIHSHRIVDTEASLWANVYPKNAELVFTWLYMSVNSDAWVHLGHWLFGAIGVTATMGITRLLSYLAVCTSSMIL